MPQRKKYNDKIAEFRALIVEDEVMVALDLELLLQSLGAVHVESVTTSKDARERLKATKFDLCVLDYHLDDGTSSGAAKIVLDANIPYIFISGDSGFTTKLREAGNVNLLQKPFSHREFKFAVSRALGTELPESVRD